MKNLWVLIGPPCSGKTTFANELIKCSSPEMQDIHELDNVRISQDDFKKHHYQMFIENIWGNTPSIIIDRMNFNVMQRCRYVLPASYLGYNIIYCLFWISPEESLKRCLARKNHPTIKTPENASSAVNNFFSQWEAPDEREPYNRIVVI